MDAPIQPIAPARNPGAPTITLRRRLLRGPLFNLILFLCTLITLWVAGTFWADPEQPLTAATGLPYALWVVAILGCHEMGHYLACRYYRVPATLPYFIPGIPWFGTFGAVIRVKGAIPDRKALFDIAAAGPIAGFVIAVPALIFGLLRAEPFVAPPDAVGSWIEFGEPLALTLLSRLLTDEPSITMNPLIAAGWFGMLITSLNLFPVGQLDGGHAVYALSGRLHRLGSRLAIGGLFLLVVYQVAALRQFPAYLLWFAIVFWMRDRHPRLRYEDGRLGIGRRLVALLLFAIFVLTFIATPIRVVDLG